MIFFQSLVNRNNKGQLFPTLLRKTLLHLWLDAAKHNNEQLRDMVDPAETAKVLEIGCHTGEWIVERVKKIQNPDIYGIDLYTKYVALSKKRGIKVVLASAEKKLPFRSSFFDLVSANQIIEHLVNVDGFLSEIYRVLKPGGYLVLSTENLSSWHNIFALCLGWQAFSQHISTIKNVGNPIRFGNYTGYELSGMHIKIFTLRGLREISELHEFTVERTFGAGYYPVIPPFSRLLSIMDSRHAAFIGIKARKTIKKDTR